MWCTLATPAQGPSPCSLYTCTLSSQPNGTLCQIRTQSVYIMHSRKSCMDYIGNIILEHFLSWIWMAVWTCVNQEGYERFPFLNGTECTHKTVQTTTNTVEQICFLCLVSRVTQHSLCHKKRNYIVWLVEWFRFHSRRRSVKFCVYLKYK
jgi:hypothetical protein